MTFQQTIIIGNVGRDPEFKYTPQGVAVCTFSVAVSKVSGRGEERKQETVWFEVTLWRDRAETASQIVNKGTKIMIIGEVSADAYVSKQTNQPVAKLKITGSQFQLLSAKGEQSAEGGVPAGARPAAGGRSDTEDPGDLPF